MKTKYLYTSILMLILAACSEHSMKYDMHYGEGNEISLQAEIDQINLSRADDSGFADGDVIGVFAVNFTSNNNPGELQPQGNLANNVAFTFDYTSYKWTGERQLYFSDDKTPVDFYGYYPYSATLNQVEDYPFTVERNQAKETSKGNLGGYEASDFLWAMTAGVSPSSSTVSLKFKHILSSVQVTLLEGDGFDNNEWNDLGKTVLVTNTNRNALIDLRTGDVSTAEDKDNGAIVMNPEKTDFRAIVIPQTVKSGNPILSITIGSQSYEFAKTEDMHFLSGKAHKFTIQVNKTLSTGDYEFSLLDEAITAWESDLTSHDGKVKEYIVVDVPQAGGLSVAIKGSNLVTSELINLKITGELNQDDFSYMRDNMKYLEALNIKGVTMRNCEIEYGRWEDYAIPNDACYGMVYLKTVVLPEKLVKIGSGAFRNTNLTGSLAFPEGLEYIGGSAYSNWQAYTESNTNLSGTLTLPSTLKFIGSSAFENCDFTGQLVLPEGLEVIEGAAFADCESFTGELHLPTSLKELGDGAFRNTKFSGNFIIPKHLTRIGNFFFPNITAISWPDAPTEISREAFWNTSLSGDIKIPETVTHIGETAFAGTKISHIIFPENLEFIESNVCSLNKFLQDTVVIPPLIETIGERAFAECEKLEAVVLPKNLLRIKSEAFVNCYSLSYIHCQAVEPPALDESAFYGIAKDNFTVEVPEESVDAYRNAPGWSEFKRIAAYRNFVARPTKYNVLNKGGKKEIILNADAEWELVECPSWCHIDKTSGNLKTILNLKVDEMTHGAGNRNGIVTFRLKNDTEYLTHINVGQYDYEYDEDEYLEIQKATKGRGIDLFFVGDGYDAIDISSGLYLSDMKQEMEYLFAVEPYTTYRDYFNVYTSFAMSEDSGVESLNRWRNTKFDTCIGDGDTRLSADWGSALDYCAETVPPIINRENPAVGVILLANSDMYEGVTYSVRGSDTFCAVVTKSTLDYPYDARGLVQHEAGGHGLGWLTDEYQYHYAFIQKCPCTCCGHVEALKNDQSFGFGLNLSLSGRYNDSPWRHLIFNPNYGDIVDIYEGGYFHSRGVYRSEYNSCMNNNVPYFSSWSRQLIVQRIMKMAGEEFDLQKFYANDSRAMGKDFTWSSRSQSEQSSYPARHGNAPIFIKDYKFGKKGGKR